VADDRHRVLTLEGPSQQLRSVETVVKRGCERRRQRGQALVEMALVFPVVLLLALGGGDLARALGEKTDVANAAREAARFAAVSGTFGGDSTENLCADHDIWNAATTESPSLPWPTLSSCDPSSGSWTAPSPTSSQCSLTIARATSPSTNHPVTVTVSCPYTPLTPMLKNIIGGNPSVTNSAVSRTDY
jgi:Flp pilus assembly protein TadG